MKLLSLYDRSTSSEMKHLDYGGNCIVSNSVMYSQLDGCKCQSKNFLGTLSYNTQKGAIMLINQH